MGGALFEGLMIVETVKAFTNAGLKPALWHWRSHDGLEVDLIIQAHGKLIPIEIKLTATPQTIHLAGLNKFRALVGEEQCEAGILVCRIPQEQSLPFGVRAVPWQVYPEWLQQIIGP
jgi:predicted AAA+ superfamily ATPase